MVLVIGLVPAAVTTVLKYTSQAPATPVVRFAAGIVKPEIEMEDAPGIATAEPPQ
jgi:hypothetical protein